MIIIILLNRSKVSMMKFKITCKHTHNTFNKTFEFVIESELDLRSHENQQYVLERALYESRQFGGSGIGSVKIETVEAI